MGDAVCYLQFLDEDGRMPEPRVTLRRVYDPPPPPGRAQGKRVLVDRGWPRGMAKEDLDVDVWARELAPSAALRRWFGHRSERWAEFRARYRDELRQVGRARLLDELAILAAQEPVTLLYSAEDRRHNQAAVILEAIEDRLPAR